TPPPGRGGFGRLRGPRPRPPLARNVRHVTTRADNQEGHAGRRSGGAPQGAEPMQRILLATVMGLALGGGVSTAAAQVPNGGYYSGGFYYTPGTSGDPYWPTNSETAYDYGVYAVAPGYGPYLRLGGESGWNPNIGTTYNSYPGGSYYADYGLPYIRLG